MLVTEYRFKKVGETVIAHKANCNMISTKDGFNMATHRHNVQVRTNCFAHQVILEDGSKSIADILVLRTKVGTLTYATCREFKELKFMDNPYTNNGSRAT
jgi:hypothetical protein